LRPLINLKKTTQKYKPMKDTDLFDLFDGATKEDFAARRARLRNRATRESLRAALAGVPCTKCLKTKLPYAHYTDSRFKTEQLVFDSREPSEEADHVAYDDRLRGWDWDAYDKGLKAAKEAGHTPSTGAFFQALLTSYHQSPVKLKKVWTGFNPSNGYQYWAFCYSVQGQ
jgi:hypothetical protein